MPDTMLERWEKCSDERVKIEEFWDWLSNDYCPKYQISKNNVILKDALNEYHNIDPYQLEKERRELLTEQKKINK